MRATRWCGWLCFLLAIPATTSRAAAPANGDARYELIEVSPSVMMALHNNGSNISCVALDDGLVFFDASLSTATAARFRHDMETRFERPTKALVLTHAHLDHILGMGAFGDVPVYAAAAGRPRWDHFIAIEWDERSIAGYAAVFPTLPQEIETATLRLPTDWFSDELVLGSAEDELVVRRTGGHTVDSSSAIIEGDGVVVAGDLVQARRRPYFGEPDTDFDAWIGSPGGLGGNRSEDRLSRARAGHRGRRTACHPGVVRAGVDFDGRTEASRGHLRRDRVRRRAPGRLLARRGCGAGVVGLLRQTALRRFLIPTG